MEQIKPDADYELSALDAYQRRVYKMVLHTAILIVLSTFIAWGVRGDELLPVRDDLFLPELTVRVMAMATTLSCVVLLSYFGGKFLVEELERHVNYDTEQLAHCGVDYFDFYLLHNMGHNVYEKCRAHDAFGFVRRKKAEGKIRQVGMSFHDAPELLEKILAEYADGLDFLQLQINYIDWEPPAPAWGQAFRRKGRKRCRRRNSLLPRR